MHGRLGPQTVALWNKPHPSPRPWVVGPGIAHGGLTLRQSDGWCSLPPIATSVFLYTYICTTEDDARLWTSLLSSVRELSYKERLCSWSCQHWKIEEREVTVIQLLNNLEYVDWEDLLMKNSRRTRHNLKLRKIKCRRYVKRFLSSEIVTNIWKCLHFEIQWRTSRTLKR